MIKLIITFCDISNTMKSYFDISCLLLRVGWGCNVVLFKTMPYFVFMHPKGDLFLLQWLQKMVACRHEEQLYPLPRHQSQLSPQPNADGAVWHIHLTQFTAVHAHVCVGMQRAQWNGLRSHLSYTLH